MADYRMQPPHKPPLRPLRLIPAGPGVVPLEGLPVAAIGREVESWLAASSEAPNADLAEGGRILAQQAWLFIEKAALTLDALPAVFRSADAPDEAFEALELISSILLALPDLMASGLEGNVARVDWMFSRLLNAPGQPGLVEVVIDTLAALDTSGTDDEAPVDHSAELEVLRGLHRDLVTLQQRWDVLIEAIFPVVFPVSASPLAGSDGKTQPTGSPANALTSTPPLKAPGPLPAGLLVAGAGSVTATPRSARFYLVGKQQQRLAVVLALVLLALIVIGMLLAQTRNTPAITPSSAAFSVSQSTPSPTTRVQPTATATPTIPSPTPTPRPQPTPSQPTPRPTPTSDIICPHDAAFCVSTLQLRVPCAGGGSVTFQLISASRGKETWQAFSSVSSGSAVVQITPSHGTLKQNQTVTLSVQANTQQKNRSGSIAILGPFGTAPISITVQVCG
ncbi:MAG TPA: hypothetical protein VFU69_14680 [Ktedonobacterales bacterium]|nr:hypothetical protein [Ktedonobacterales bacterium]